MRPRAWVGTSGYDYNHWKDAFYPPEMPRKERLAHYVRAYDTVEINNTFYSLPSPQTVERWRDVAREERGDAFRFVLKGSQFLTHRKKLNEPRRPPLAQLLDRADILGELCVGFLWQFPGGWKANPARLQAFVDDLRDMCSFGHRARWWHAFEFRHGSWLHEPVLSILREADMPLVLTDMPFQVIVPGYTEARDIPRPVVTAPLTSDRLVYVRKHGPLGHFGGSYPEEMTEADARDAQRWLDEGREVYAFFNNDPWAHAVGDARRLAERLGRPSHAHPSARRDRLHV